MQDCTQALGLCSLWHASTNIGMSNGDNDSIDPMLVGEEPSKARSTPAKPVVDETWTQVEELPEDDDAEFTDEEVRKHSAVTFAVFNTLT